MRTCKIRLYGWDFHQDDIGPAVLEGEIDIDLVRDVERAWTQQLPKASLGVGGYAEIPQLIIWENRTFEWVGEGPTDESGGRIEYAETFAFDYGRKAI